jgi:hypothetical protein
MLRRSPFTVQQGPDILQHLRNDGGRPSRGA